MKASILIVDDEVENLSALERLLRKNFELTLADSGEKGLEVIKSKTPGFFSVVVSDQRMPHLSGSEFLEIVKSLDPNLTRILMTGFADLEAVTSAVNKGEIWRYISKPWEPQDLILTLMQACERTETTRQLERSLKENSRQLDELKAKEWSRHYLFKILLHEFRTAPQILEAALSFNKDGEVEKYIKRLMARFSSLEEELKDYLDFEKTLASTPKLEIDLTTVLQSLPFPFEMDSRNSPSGDLAKYKVAIFDKTFQSGLGFLHRVLSQNSAQAKPATRIDFDFREKDLNQLFIEFKISASTPLSPLGLQSENLYAPVAWRALLEPFVGVDSLLTHSKGLRLEASRWMRNLGFQGIRVTVETENQGCEVKFVCSIPVLSLKS
jgi:FixJ family two-component response regulator